MQCLSARKQKRLFSSRKASLQPSAINFCMSICRDVMVSKYCGQGKRTAEINARSICDGLEGFSASSHNVSYCDLSS